MQPNKLTQLQYKKIIRIHMRSLRHSVKLSEQYTAAQLITNKILTLSQINQSTNIAMFMSFDGEIRTDLIIKILLSINKKIYLPIVPTNRFQPLLFARYTLSTPLIKNRFNIYEPKYYITSILPVKMLDIIFVPLVAFDKNKNRLGMGGGFYDKLLYNQNQQKNCIHIGLGYDFQKISENLLPIDIKDKKLSKIITPHYVY